MSSGYNGYLMLNKEIKRHEYFTDYKTFHLFFWLLSDANFIEGNFRGVEVKRGQKLTSLNSLIIETGLTEREVRTALEKLIKGNHIVKKTTNQFHLLTVVEYEFYTGSNEVKDKPTTNQRQTKGKPTTTIEEFNNTKKEEFKKIERVNNNSLSNFDFLFSNFKTEIERISEKYRPQMNNYGLCKSKFNTKQISNIQPVHFESYCSNWVTNDNKNSNKTNNTNEYKDPYKDKNGKIGGMF